MQFEMMHLSMLARHPDLFDVRVAITREAWLREVFAERITFTHFKEQFHFVPELDATVETGGLIVGRIGRRVSVSENEPPEEGLHETQRPAWMAAHVFIDPAHHDEGQRVAFQHRSDVGKPFAIFTSLARHINQVEPRHPYTMEVAAISDAQSFWDFADKNKGAVTNVEFDLVTPNMFDGPENMDAEMKALRDAERARKIKIAFENEDSLELDTPRIKTIVDYAARGGGDIKARAKNRKKYDSKRKIKSVPVPEPKENDAKAAVIALLNAAKSLIFGK